MPPVVAFTILFVTGLVAGHTFRPPWWAALPALGVVLALARRSRWTALLGVTVLVGALHGGIAARSQRAGCAAVWRPGRHAAIVRLEDAPDRNGLANGVVRYAVEGCRGALRLRLSGATVPSGATLVIVGTAVPGVAFGVSHLRVLRRPIPLRFVVRDAIARRAAGLYGARAPLVDALVLGRRGNVDPRLRAEFVAAGLAHLLAISGLHVGIVAAWLVLVGRLCGLGHRATWMGAVGVWLYAGLLGFPAPATRAAVFVAIHVLAAARQRHPPPSAVLAVAVLVVVALDPGAVRQAGAWLSVSAAWGTAVADAALRRARKPHAAVRLLAGSAGAVLATAPVTAFVFGQVALAGLVTNLAAVPLAGVMVPGVLGSLALGKVMAGGAGLLLALIEGIATLGSHLPLGRVAGDPGMGFAVPWVAVAALAWWYIRRRPTLPTLAVRLTAALALVVWGALAREWWTRDRYDGLTLFAINVGQGDAIALRSPHGHWALVDAGPRGGGRDAGRQIVAPFLRRHGVRSLDLLVVTHGDADHVGGTPSVLAAVPTELVLEPGQPLASAFYREFLAAVEETGARWRAARRGDSIAWDGVRIAVLHPTNAWVDREVRPNENSVVLRVSYGAFDALLTGDAGLPVESLLVASGQGAQVELLKVGHHGSAGSTGPAWLGAVRPRAAVISVGTNGYGHPSPAVLERLRAEHIPAFRTDRGGTVTVRTDGQYFVVRQAPRISWIARFLCQTRDWLPSKASSSSRNGCSPRPRASSPTSFTTWPSPPR